MKSYKLKGFWRDLFGGLTVGSLLVPQGMAYANLIGIPEIYGLYAGIVPILVFAFFSTTNRLAVGPVALSALLIYAGLAPYYDHGSPELIAMVILSGFLIGVFQLLLGVFRLGFVANFLSKPVLSGFISAATIVIISTQLPHIIGAEAQTKGSIYQSFLYFFQSLGETNYYDFSFFAGSCLVMWAASKISKYLPSALIALVLSILICYFFQLDQSPLAILRDVPSGLPIFSIPEISFENIKSIIPLIITVALVGFVESISIAKVLETKHQDHEVEANKELIALGLSKIVGSFFQSIPTSGSFSRSAINSISGAKTHVSSLASVLLVICALLFLCPIFFYLPKAVLSAIIIMSVIKLFDVKAFVHLWKTHKTDFVIMLVTFIVTLFVGIEEGIISGVLFSFMAYINEGLTPSITVLESIEGTDLYKDPKRFSTSRVPDTLILRYNGNLFFGNSYHFKENLLEYTNDIELKQLILDGGQIDYIDSTGIAALENVIKELKKKEINFYLCGAIGQVRDKMYLAGLLRDENMHHASVANAITFINTGVKNYFPDQTDYSMQSNEK